MHTWCRSPSSASAAAPAASSDLARKAAERAKAVAILEDELSRVLALIPEDKREEARRIIIAGGGYGAAASVLKPATTSTTSTAPSAQGQLATPPCPGRCIARGPAACPEVSLDGRWLQP